MKFASLYQDFSPARQSLLPPAQAESSIRPRERLGIRIFWNSAVASSPREVHLDQYARAAPSSRSSFCFELHDGGIRPEAEQSSHKDRAQPNP